MRTVAMEGYLKKSQVNSVMIYVLDVLRIRL